MQTTHTPVDEPPRNGLHDAETTTGPSPFNSRQAPPSPTQWGGMLLLLALGALFWVPHLRDWWVVSQRYDLQTHAPLLFGLAAFHFWLRRDRLRRWESANPWGLALLAGSGLLHFAAAFGDVLFLRFFSLLGLTAGVIWYLGGTKVLKASLGPLGFFALALPLPTFLAERLTPPLQNAISAYTALLLGLLGFPITREGVQLAVTPDLNAPPLFSILVAQACSGLASLIVLLALGYLAAYHTPVRAWAKALMMAAMLPLMLLVNALRAGGILVAGAYHSRELAHWFHDNATVFLLFCASVAILLMRMLLMSWDAARIDRDDSTRDTDSAPGEAANLPFSAERSEGEPAGV